MTWTGTAGVIAVALSAYALARFAARLLQYRARPLKMPGEANAAVFSLRRYRPMNRLLSGDDLEFLRSQPGYRRETGRKLGHRRRRIFRQYLRELASTFHQLHAALRLLVTESPAGNSDLVATLMRQQFVFWRAIFVIELKLLFPGPHRIEIPGLLETLEAMRSDLARYSVQAAA